MTLKKAFRPFQLGAACTAKSLSLVRRKDSPALTPLASAQTPPLAGEEVKSFEQESIQMVGYVPCVSTLAVPVQMESDRV